MAAVKFPQRVKRGSCLVTIYSTPTKGRELYTLAYYAEDGRRLRSMFADYEAAKAHADEVVEKLFGSPNNQHQALLTRAPPCGAGPAQTLRRLVARDQRPSHAPTANRPRQQTAGSPLVRRPQLTRTYDRTGFAPRLRRPEFGL